MVVLAGALGVPPHLRAQLAPLTSAELVIQGNRLTLFADALTTDAEQTVNVAERATVRTCFGGPELPCGSVAAGDPRIAGLVVKAELRGPELPDAVPFETLPGGAFLLPGFQQEGDYFLENIRLVSAATGQVLGFAEPPLAVLHVRQIVLARASVRQLTLAELQARGVTLTEENFQAFDFAVGFAIDGEVVEIEFPVLFQGAGVLNPLGAPRIVNLDVLPPETRATIRRWQPPNIIPFRLEPCDEPGLDPDQALQVLEGGELDNPCSQERLGVEEREDLIFPLFGAIVIPGTVTYLNQFFDAQLIVANGAPAGSSVTLEELRGSLRLPGGRVLRLAATDPPVAPGQAIPVERSDGVRVLAPGQEGTASWTVEGLVAGSHALQIDITGDLVRPGRDPFPVLSRVQAAVEVVDARFNLTFSHPDVVREGEAYSLFVTVSNLSQALQQGITVHLGEITGAHLENQQDGLSRFIEELTPGQAETVEIRLVSDLDGKVVATTFQATSSAGQGTIELRTGVGELGIPLSPATLLLPRFSELLAPPHLPSDELLRANVRLLGLAYSLASAPAGKIPPELPRVIRSDVERRAVDLAEAGQRIFLQEHSLESLEALLLDQLGNRHPLVELDELRRRTSKGLRAAAELASVLRAEQGNRSLDAVGLFDHFASTMSYADPYLAAILVPSSGAPSPRLVLEGRTVPGTLFASSDDEAQAVRGLPFGEIYALQETNVGGASVPFVVVGHLEGDDEIRVVLRNDGAVTASGRLVLVVPAGTSGDFRRVDLGIIDVPPFTEVAVDAGAGVPDVGANGFRLFDPTSGLPLAGAPLPSQATVDRPPFRIVGAVQDFRLAEEGPDQFGNYTRPNRYGNAISYLFNRPPDRTTAEQASRYHIRSSWSGLDTAGAAASRVSEKVGVAAFFQENSERVVHVRYDTGIAALVNGDDSPAVAHEHLIENTDIFDEYGEWLSSNVPPPIIESPEPVVAGGENRRVPRHVGGLIEGRVVRGTGEGAAGVRLELVRLREFLTFGDPKIKLDLAGSVTTGPDGSFYLDFVEGCASPTGCSEVKPHWDRRVLGSYVLRATVPPGPDPELEPEVVQEVSSLVRLENRLAKINVALLGRGRITGTLVDRVTQAPVSGGNVQASSTLFRESRAVPTAADGTFVIPSMPVGPITLIGVDLAGERRVVRTVVLDQPGQVLDVRLELEPVPPRGQGAVFGTVQQLLSSDPSGPRAGVPGASVQVYSEGEHVATVLTDASGRYQALDVPAGQVSLQAASGISRSAAFVDLLLAAGESRRVDLLLVSGTRTVTGVVQLRDPGTGALAPLAGAVAFIAGPGVFDHTDAQGRYRLEGVPLQGSNETYRVTAIDFARRLQGEVPLLPVVETSPDVIDAQPIVLEQMAGGVDGVVLDPLGRPAAGVEVVIPLVGQTTTAADGSFGFDDVPLGTWRVAAHVDDGLTPGKVGSIAERPAEVLFGGHRPFVSLRMVGSGFLDIHAHTASSSGQLTPLFYRPTIFSDQAKRVTLKGPFIQASTLANGTLRLELPVGAFELIAFNPFHDPVEIKGPGAVLTYAGQVKPIDILFEDASTVAAQVVDVDGVTPVVGIPVKLYTQTLLPQTLTSDAQGRVRFELVPKGNVALTAAGLVGTVERVGRSDGAITIAGQTLELVVRMKAQGTVRGRVLVSEGTDLSSLSGAQLFVKESSFPYRRLPEGGAFLTTDQDGRYEIPHLFAGGVTVVARDTSPTSAGSGTASGEITADFQVVELPDIVLSSLVANLTVVVRDPDTGAPVADALVRLSNDEATVTDAVGTARFEALALDQYSIYAFFAPTGRSGRVSGVNLAIPGDERTVTVYLEQRGQVSGTLYDDPTLLVAVANGTVLLSGATTSGPFSAAATTSGATGEVGRFLMEGIPEGSFFLTGAVQESVRRAHAQVAVTKTSPAPNVNLVLEEVADIHLRLFESLTSGVSPVDPASTVVGVRLTQTGFDFTLTEPEPGSDRYRFPDVLVERPADVEALEVIGEQRRAFASIPDLRATGGPLAGSGTFGDPYRLVLSPKGVVDVEVHDAGGASVAGASVTVRSSGGGSFPTVSDADGSVTLFGVPAGTVTATATSPTTGLGGVAQGVLSFDDEVLPLVVSLAPAVSAHGRVFLPVPDDRYLGDPSVLEPAAGRIVQITDAAGVTQTTLTAADGSYHFDGLAVGAYSLLRAQSTNGDQVALAAGTLAVGIDNLLPDLILDASPPRIVSLVPPTGLKGVSRTATVEIVFSEPLNPLVLPTEQGTSGYFSLRSADGALASGDWSAELVNGTQVVRFVPSAPYQNSALYSLTIVGGTNGVRDRIDRPLVESGNVGSSFETSDTVGPSVLGTEPSLDLPVDPAASIRVDFSEAVVATAEQLDGDGIGDAGRIVAIRNDASEAALPVTLSLTRGDFSLRLVPVPGISVSDDSLQRRLEVSGLEDRLGNPMPPFARTYRIHDENAPAIVEVPFPDGAPTGELRQGASYTLVPVLGGLDDVTPENPGGDLARVDYFFVDPLDPANALAGPGFSSPSYPFQFDFVGAYAGNGVDAEPFPVWVRAVDTSGNASNVVLVDMQVLPNDAPAAGTVTVTATAPVAGTFYAGSTIEASVAGFDDPDGNQLTIAVELWRVGEGAPLDSLPGRTVMRPAGGWAEAPTELFQLELDLSLAEGTSLVVRARVLDGQGAEATADSAGFAIADDALPPQFASLVARRSDGAADLTFFIGQTFHIELEAQDLETAVSNVALSLDRTDLFPDPLVAHLVAGGLYRSDDLTVPAEGITVATPLQVIAEARDYGDNVETRTLTLELAPEPDPTAPTAEWLTPWQAAPWPADYTSVAGGGAVAFLLRAEVRDTSLDAGGAEVPGTIAAVTFRGPVVGAGGAIELASEAEAQVGELVAGSEEPGAGIYQALWTVPDQVPAGTELPFVVRAIDTGGQAVVRTVTMTARPSRKVYEGTSIAVFPSDPMHAVGGDLEGLVFLVDGTTLSLYPQEGSVRRIPGLVIYAGGNLDAGVLVPEPSILTAPETDRASAIPFYPLELEVDELFAVGAGSAVDLAGRGLLGGEPPEAPVVLPGETPSADAAGGSHGGSGWYGSPCAFVFCPPELRGWERPGLLPPGSVYDSVRDPRLPGGGGGGVDAGVPGGAGGGVFRLLAAGATVRLAGDVLAAGGDGLDSAAAGAGGSIRLLAGRLEGRGRIDASGGDSSEGLFIFGVGVLQESTGGGGGGRISISYQELGPEVDLDAQVAASGGRDRVANPLRLAGAGTIYLEALDPLTGAPTGIGDLRVAGATGPLAAAVTPLPALGEATLVSIDAAAGRVLLDAADARGDITGDGVHFRLESGEEVAAFRIVGESRITDASAPAGFRVALDLEATEAGLDDLATLLSTSPPVLARGRSRYASVEGRGRSRLVFDDELEIGPVGDPAPALDDRAAVALDADARLLLQSEGPSLSIASVTPAPGSDVLPGTPLEVSWSAADPLGFFSSEEAFDFDAQPLLRGFGDDPQAIGGSSDPLQLSVPIDAPPGAASLTLEVADLAGRRAGEVLTWNVLADVEAPAVTLTFSPESADDTYLSGESVAITATAEDNVAVTAFTLSVNGESVSGPSPLVVAFDAPVVSTLTPFQVLAVAVDPFGNETTVPRTLQVEPPASTTGPEVTVVCPSPGALVAPGTGLDLLVDATDVDNGVERVELFLDAEPSPFAVLAAPPYAARVLISPDAVAGEQPVVRVVARDFAGVTTEVTLPLRVVEGLHLTGNTTVTAADSSLDGQTLIVEGGTFTVDGVHTFGDLVILDGATLTHPATTTTVQYAMDLSLTGGLYVACGGAVDVSGRGYTQGRTYPNSTVDGVLSSSSASYGGSGLGNGTNPTYGSLFDPADPGSGGRFSTPGGGVIRIESLGDMLVDGSVVANATDNASAPYLGSGGSVRLAAPAVGGRGTIEASSPSGGGGRIAIYSDDLATDLLSRVAATGAGAGTIYLKRSDQQYGELLVDGGEQGATELTPLVSVGRGLVDSATADTITDASAQFRHTLEGVRLALNDDLSQLFTITGHAHKGQTLAVDPPSLTAQAGDLYQGVYRFDRVVVRNGARLVLADRLLTETPPEVETGAIVADGDPAGGPVATMRLVSTRTGEILDDTNPAISGEGVRVELSAVSPFGLDRFELEVSGAVSDSSTFPLGGLVEENETDSFSLPGGSGGQTVSVVFRAFDLEGRSVQVQRTLSIVPDEEPPVVTILTPAEGTSYVAGDVVRVTVALADNVAYVPFVDVELGGARQLDRSIFLDIDMLAPPVASTTLVPITVTAVDLDGNVGTAVRFIEVSPLADGVAPTLELACGAQGGLAVPGLGVPISGTATDDLGLFSVEAFVGTDSVGSSYFANDFLFDAAIPDTLVDGEIVPLRVVATDFGGNTAEQIVQLDVVTGTVLSADLNLGASDTSLDGTSVIVASGTLTVEGPHTFQNLVVLDGILTHPATDAATEQSLELTVTGNAFVGCRGTVTAAGRGYLGGLSGVGTTFPNSPVGGAQQHDGGSHGGQGGGFGPAIYDNVFDPRSPGGGGGSQSTFRQAGQGGGVIRITVAGDFTVDGTVDATGASVPTSSSYTNIGAGAGGSIRLDAQSLDGAGTLSAEGGSNGTSTAHGGTGGGGRIALYAASIDPGLIANTSAAGGDGGAFVSSRGAPGTLFVKLDGQLLGDLILDNRGRTHSLGNSLPQVGTGIVDAFGADSITDFSASFRYSVVGVEVGFNFDNTTLWRITAHEHLGNTLTLDTSGQPLTVQVGDTYRGVYRFDRVFVRGSASVRTPDVVLSTEDPVVESGSTWVSGNVAPPEIDPGLVNFTSGAFGLTLVGAPGAVSDPDLPARLYVTNNRSGEEFPSVEVRSDGSFAVPVAAVAGDTFALVARDSGFPTLTSPPQIVGPVVGDVGLAPRFEDLGLSGDLVAVDGSLMAVCECLDFFGGGGAAARGGSTSELVGKASDLGSLTLLDLSDPLRPQVASVVSIDPNPDFAADVELPFYDPVSALAVGDGVVAIVEGRRLLVIDARDPYNPVFDSSEQVLQLSSLKTFAVMAIDDGYIHLVESVPDSGGGGGAVRGGPTGLDRASKAFFPREYVVIGLQDPGHPVVLAQSALPARDVVDVEVKDGLLYLLSNDFFDPQAELQIFAVGDPVRPLRRNGSDLGAENRSGVRLEIVDDVAVYTLTDSTVATFHRSTPPSEEPHQTSLIGPDGFSTPGRDVVEVGDRLLVAFEFDARLAVGSLDTSFTTHGFTQEEVVSSPFTSFGSPIGIEKMSVENGLLWLFGKHTGRGVQSSLLQPWLDEAALSLVFDGTDASATGLAGAAAGAAAVRASFAGGTLLAPVAADGSFDLALGLVEAGEPITLQAFDAGGNGGNKVRLHLPPGTNRQQLPLAAGAARLSTSGGVGVVLPARQPAGAVTLSLVDVAAGVPAVLGGVTVNGPVTDVLLQDGLLYVAGSGLEVFDVTVPGAPTLEGSLDPFAGNPVVALAIDGARLYALGDAGSGQRLETFDLTDPRLPSLDPSLGVAVGVVPSPRLFVNGGELWLIGDGVAQTYSLTLGAPPALLASGAFPGSHLLDLELDGGGVYAAVQDQGIRELVTAGASLELGPSPVEPHPVLGLFRLAGAGGMRLWWAEGLGGAKTNLRQEMPAAGVTSVVYGVLRSGCFLHDAAVVGDALYLLTDCGVERLDLPSTTSGANLSPGEPIPGDELATVVKPEDPRRDEDALYRETEIGVRVAELLQSSADEGGRGRLHERKEAER